MKNPPSRDGEANNISAHAGFPEDSSRLLGPQKPNIGAEDTIRRAGTR